MNICEVVVSPEYIYIVGRVKLNSDNAMLPFLYQMYLSNLLFTKPWNYNIL